ncbi:NB-ARC domain-containing protein [Gordonia sp. FQ]|uniref:NB-ARC domain-containing protein n=1 Tax=Gordonia sp. FQ TaxID=3446634 RepID=UPI003F87AE15
MDQGVLSVVFVHGVFSGPHVFDGLASCLSEDDGLDQVKVARYRYSTPKFCFNPTRVIPDLDVIADGLWTFLGLEAPEPANLYLVGHSQGGLAIQRMLIRQLNADRGHELSRIRGVSLFACPSHGSEIVLTLRKTLLGRHPQDRQLRPFATAVAETHANVVQRVDQALNVSPSRCPIPITAYLGETDGVVPVASGRGSFRTVHVLPGDHSSILDAPTLDSPAWRALRRDIRASLLHPTRAALGGETLVTGQIPGEPQTFVDRDLVRRLSVELSSSPVVVVTALTGMRGVGKTQVAAACARAAVTDRVPLVAWINAETEDTLLTGLARVAERLGLVDEGTDHDEATVLLREHLSSSDQPSLLVLDNAEDPALAHRIVPATGHAKVIITTTNRAFRDLATAIDVDTFERTESIEYLLGRTESTDRRGADQVADELGDLPLALAAISAYARRRQLTFAQCLADLEAYPVVEVLGRGRSVEYPHSTTAALLLAIDSVASGVGGDVARSLLEIIANLSPDGVNRDLLTQVATGSGEGWSNADIEDALERCVSASILSWSQGGNAVIMHRLMGRVIRERTSRAGRADIAVADTLRLVQDGIDAEPAWSGRDASLHLVQQIEALATNVFETGEDAEAPEHDD